MRLRRLAALLTAPMFILGLLAAPPPAEAASRTPSPITSVTATPGASPGTVVFRWSSAGRNTDYFLLQTGLTAFNTSVSSSLPRSGRHAATFKIPAQARSWTMSKAQAVAAGAPLGSGNFFYYRFLAVNKVGSKTFTKAYPRMQTVMPKGPAVRMGTVTKTTGPLAHLRVATFNVRTVNEVGDKRTWLQRVDHVAGEILDSHAGVVAVQELSPGAAVKGGVVKKVGRQTTSLVDALHRRSGKKRDYRMVRTTSYVRNGLPRGSQGGRILYDNKRYKLISNCPEYTRKDAWNAACSFKLPILPSDRENMRLRGGYALLQDRATRQRFWVISAHLDYRHSSSPTTGKALNRLRGAQARALVALANRLDTAGYPVILGADTNTWYNDPMGYSAHDALIAGGFYDAKSADRRVNAQFPTVNKFLTRLTPSTSGFGSHLDVVMMRGGRGEPVRWVNMMRNPDPNRPSDHNLVYADITI